MDGDFIHFITSFRPVLVGGYSPRRWCSSPVLPSTLRSTEEFLDQTPARGNAKAGHCGQVWLPSIPDIWPAKLCRAENKACAHHPWSSTAPHRAGWLSPSPEQWEAQWQKKPGGKIRSPPPPPPVQHWLEPAETRPHRGRKRLFSAKGGYFALLLPPLRFPKPRPGNW